MKCQHEACGCSAIPDEDAGEALFCSRDCARAADQRVEADCPCDHPGCVAPAEERTTEVPHPGA